MSFIVKGVDLPKEGTVINLIVQSDGEAQYITLGDGELIVVKEAQAVQIPKDHGRLIDEKDLTLCEYDLPDYFWFRAVPEEALSEATTILEAEE